MPSRILRLWNPDTSAWEEVGDSRLTVHLADPNGHPVYLTQTEADALYAPIGGGGGSGMASDALWDAKGDLAVGSGANTGARLAPGTDGQVLTLDAAQALGVKWAAPAGGGGGDFVELAGDTMTGTLTFNGAAVSAGGAVVVDASVAGTDRRVYGAGSPTFAPSTGGASFDELGVAFSVSTAATLVAVRWYRLSTGQATPTAARLWDSTATGAAVWSAATPAAWTDTAVGWKEHRLAAGTGPALVAGRTYALSYGGGSVGSNTSQAAYTPAPEAPLAFGSHVLASSVGLYPATTGTTAWGIDPVVQASGGGSPPAQSGAVRLPNAAEGTLAWRNAGNTADLPLTVNTSNALTFNGSPLLTQAVADPLYLSPTEGDAVYLKLTGGTLSGNLGVGVAPPAWAASQRALNMGQSVALWGGAANVGGALGDNTYYDGTNFRAVVAGAASYALVANGAVHVVTAPSVAAGAAQTFTTRLQVAQNGTVTLTPEAGQAALATPGTAGNWSLGHASGGAPANNFGLTAPPGWVAWRVDSVAPATTFGTTVLPGADNALSCGVVPGGRWTYVASVAGALNTSLAEAKQAITPLSPEDALAAVRATDPVLFDYKPPERGPEWYELPDDPEQAAQVLEQRMRAAPLEEGARHQAGVVLNHGTYRTDPLFVTGDGQTNASNSFGVLLAALKNLDQRLSALEGA